MYAVKHTYASLGNIFLLHQMIFRSGKILGCALYFMCCRRNSAGFGVFFWSKQRIINANFIGFFFKCFQQKMMTHSNFVWHCLVGTFNKQNSDNLKTVNDIFSLMYLSLLWMVLQISSLRKYDEEAQGHVDDSRKEASTFLFWSPH